MLPFALCAFAVVKVQPNALLLSAIDPAANVVKEAWFPGRPAGTQVSDRMADQVFVAPKDD